MLLANGPSEFGLACEYNRERKKRGKASRRDMEKQKHAPGTSVSDAGAQDSPKSGPDQSPESNQPFEQPLPGSSSHKRRRSSDQPTRPDMSQSRSMTMPSQQMTNGLPHITPHPQNDHQMVQNLNSVATRNHYNAMQMPMAPQDHVATVPNPHLPNSSVADRTNSMAMGDFVGPVDDYHRRTMQQPVPANGQQHLMPSANALQNQMGHVAGVLPYGDSPYNIAASPQSQAGLNAFRIGGSPISAGNQNFMGTSPNAGSPGWLQLPSPSAALYTGINLQSANQYLRYPVLKPILPRISAIIPPSLACDLLELYFSSSYSTFVQPASPYVLGFFFRKRSFLRQQNPRSCSPALLASILWVAAQTSESSFLTSPPSARGRVCQQLLELTISLLRPLIHTPADGVTTQGTNPVINGVALGGFGVAHQTSRHDNEGGSMGATGALDDVATYINLATVVSASEYKGASLRWWNAAWSLARELKLGRELPPNPEPPMHSGEDAMGDGATDEAALHGQAEMHKRPNSMHTRMNMPGMVSEEEREERRRIWWLLYIVDRHLALCYNRPLFLLDAECDALLQPEDDAVFQAGEYYPAENQQENYFRRRGPGFECTGHGIFGYFLPLMTILGEIVDLNHARNHPRFGFRMRNGSDLDEMQNEITLQLNAYGRSLEAFEARFAPPDKPQAADDKASPTNQSTGTSANRMTEPVLLTRIIVAYGTHLMHTLHIALNGKWDPISLIDDNDLWISSQSFITATGHAVSAAEAISGILDYDPDLSFMPFFFGIYLLQGSFLLLLIADKLQGEASPAVVKACETIVRAHEVCVVTLNTEYQVSRLYASERKDLTFLNQRNFRKVMRSALQQVRGRTLEDFGEQQQRRREVLALYRWTGDGTGLAL